VRSPILAANRSLEDIEHQPHELFHIRIEVTRSNVWPIFRRSRQHCEIGA
jgi:hypothetical protein